MCRSDLRSPRRRLSRQLVGALAFVMGTTSIGGCHRAHYRTQADQNVSEVVTGATANPRFQLPGHDIGIDPRSRLYDPTDPDSPPMPPDDPDSHRLMECVDGHTGWKRWTENGELADVEINDYRGWLPYDTDGKIRVDLLGALQLARLHSRDYQSQLETLYLSALDVTAERFQFESQFFASNAMLFGHRGRIRNGGSSSSQLGNDADVLMRRTFTTGGTFVLGLANSIVWQFSGPDSNMHTSLANFAISQPLLQFAGKARIMERLTRSERSLLANVRQYERFRQGFYLDVTAGSGVAGGLQRTGGLFAGSGLSGFTGVGVGGFGGVGAIGVTSSGGFSGGGGTGANSLSGFLGLMQQQLNLRNQRARVASLRATWLQLNAAYDAGRLENRFQVDLAKQAYYGGQSQYLNMTAGYESLLDVYKMRLGLPPDTPLVVKDPFFEQFDLVSRELIQLENDVGTRIENLGNKAVAGDQPPATKVPMMGDPMPGRTDETRKADRTPSLSELASSTRTVLDQITTDFTKLASAIPVRRESLASLAQHPELQDGQFDLQAMTTEAFDDRLKQMERDRYRVTDDVSTVTTKLSELADDDMLTPDERRRAEKSLLERLSGSLLELTLIQVRARLHSVTLVPVDVSPEQAFQVALARRPDWMNAKAALVDTWRLIEFNANALKTNVTVNIDGDIGTTGNNPLKFRDANGQLRAGLQIDPPLTRLIERNQYRQSLIDYQQARRSVMAQRDEIQRGLRARLRQIHLDQFNLELRRLAMEVAITQVDAARLELVKPERPSPDGKPATSAASSTLARDLIDALGNLQQTQSDFMNVWGDYEMQRRLLDFDLGTMSLDEHGSWIDPGPVTDEKLLAHYYDAANDPFSGMTPSNSIQPGIVELAPDEFPPEVTPVE